MEEITVDVAPDGSVNITTKGFRGRACKTATKPLEEALGVVTKDVDTPEMHLQEQVQTKARG
jgi:hypothetical protein